MPALVRIVVSGFLFAAFAVLGTVFTPSSARAQFVCDADTAGEDGLGATGVGGANHACGLGAIASGTGSGNTAIATSNASGDFSANTAVGRFANATGNQSFNIAIGDDARASGDGRRNTAVGSSSVSTGLNTSAFGGGASATGNFSTSVGGAANANGLSSTAIGTEASAAHANSAAFGRGAGTTRANQQMFGTAANTYTMRGIASAASKSAQSGPLEVVTSDANGNLATDGGAIFDRLEENSEGVAMALAMAGTFLPQPGETFRISGNWGNFEGSNALSFGGAMDIGEGVYLTGGVGAGLEEGTLGGRAGLSIGW